MMSVNPNNLDWDRPSRQPKLDEALPLFLSHDLT